MVIMCNALSYMYSIHVMACVALYIALTTYSGVYIVYVYINHPTMLVHVGQ